MKKRDDIITNNLYELMLKDSAKKTLETGEKFPVSRMVKIYSEIFGYSTHSIMAIRNNNTNVPIDKAIMFCDYFNITLYEFYNIPQKNKGGK